MKKERKVDANEVLQTQKHSYSSYDEAPSIPHHTVEMMYTAVQKRHKDSENETDTDKGDAPPIPPYTGEEYHIRNNLIICTLQLFSLLCKWVHQQKYSVSEPHILCIVLV